MGNKKIATLFLLLTGIIILGAGCETGDIKQVIDNKDEIMRLQNEQINMLKEELNKTKTLTSTESGITTTTGELKKATTESTQITKPKQVIAPKVTSQPKTTVVDTEKTETTAVLPSNNPTSSPVIIENKPTITTKDPIIGESVVSVWPATLYTIEQSKIDYQQASIAYSKNEIGRTEFAHIMALHTGYVRNDQFCKTTYGTKAIADVKTGQCYCNSGGLVIDKLKGECVTYEQYCRNNYGEESMYSDMHCIYCQIGYKLQRSGASSQCYYDPKNNF